MKLEQNLIKKNRFSTVRQQNIFYTYKGYPFIEENERFMRRYETGYRYTRKHWILGDENEFFHR